MYNLVPFNRRTVVGVFNDYEVHIFRIIEKEQPHRPGTKVYMQNAPFLHEICMKCFSKHIYSTQIGIPHILKHNYWFTVVSL